MLITYVERKPTKEVVTDRGSDLGTFANFYQEEYFLPIQVPRLVPFERMPSSFNDELSIVIPFVEEDICYSLRCQIVVNPVFNLLNYEDYLPFIYIQEDDSSLIRVLWNTSLVTLPLL